MLFFSGEKIRQFGPEELRQAAQELENRGAHTEFAMAKRLVRLCKYLAVTGTIYRPKLLLDPATSKDTLATYYQATWEKLLPGEREGRLKRRLCSRASPGAVAKHGS
jgi:hypothetical protein